MTAPRVSLPYGPNTVAVRRFLQRLAGKPTSDCALAARAYLAMQGSHDLIAADRLLGTAIERSGRTDARDAIVGPIVQLMTGHEERLAVEPGLGVDDLAEAALAAALALIARDIIPSEAFEVLYQPFEPVVPAGETGAG